MAEAYAKLGLAQRRRASLWHGGQDTALYAVSCDLMLGLPYFKQAAEELTQALAEAPQELEPEDRALLDEVQDTIAVLSGYCWVGCLKRRPWIFAGPPPGVLDPSDVGMVLTGGGSRTILSKSRARGRVDNCSRL